MIGSLEGIKEINGKKVMTNEERPLDANGNVDWDAFDEMRNEFPICVDHEKDMISFKMLTKPASEGGDLNRCQVMEMIVVARHIISKLNDKFPCRENAITLTKLDEAILWQRERTRERTERGVEGKYHN